jgi:hypothetical protein
LFGLLPQISIMVAAAITRMGSFASSDKKEGIEPKLRCAVALSYPGRRVSQRTFLTNGPH